MKKLALIAAALLAASPALAVEWQFKTNTTYNQQNLVGRYSAQITHNGEAVSTEQTEYPGHRAELVQQLLSLPGQPHNK